MKKILFLGAAQFQIPPIEYALSKGYYVITCDNRVENPGHKLSNKYYNVSTLEKDEILKIALAENIDGILTFGSDVSAPTMAYVAEKMGLPGNSYKTVSLLVNKKLFREHLNKNNLQKTQFKIFSESERSLIGSYLKDIELPVVIKPIDSAGSKGVSILSNISDLDRFVDYAFSESFSRTIIIESWIKKLNKQVCGDGFMQNDKLEFIEFGDGHFYDDGKFLAPFAETFPSTHIVEHLNKIKIKLEKILVSCGFLCGPFNFDVLVAESGEPFVVEIGPRSGGNYIPKAISLKTKVDMIGGAVECSLDRSFKLDVKKSESEKFYACYMIHSKSEGILDKISFDEDIEANIVEYNPYIKLGANVKPFYKASEAIGNLILVFNSHQEMLEKISKMSNYCRVELKQSLTKKHKSNFIGTVS